MNARYNAVIVGQTGVGKSSLINYLYGQNIAEAGVGKPVTKNGFHAYDFKINGLPVCVFDSWGLEADKYNDWMSELDKEFQQRGVNESAEKWFHSVFYCIQAGGARLQDCDITIIKKFMAENYKVSVVLTKCDQVSLEQEEILRTALQNEIKGISVIPICNVKMQTRMGVTEPFGKEDVERQAFNDFFDSLILRLPLRCKSIMEDTLENWVKESELYIANNIGYAGHKQKSVEKEICESAKQLELEFLKLINAEIEQTSKMYGTFASCLGYPPSNFKKTVYDTEKFNQMRQTKDMDWSSFMIGAILLFPYTLTVMPLMFTLGASGTKKGSIKSVEGYVYMCKNEFGKIISSQVKQVTKMLEESKLKVINEGLGK